MNLKLIEMSEKIKNMIFSFPLVLLMSLLMTISVNYLISYSYPNQPPFFIIKLVIVSALGISLLFAVKTLSQRIGKELIWSVLGILILVGIYFILPSSEKDFTEMYYFILVPLFILSHLLVSFIAFIQKEDSEKKFWQFNKNLFIHIFLTGVFTGVLIGGVELAILAVDNLFNVGFNDRVYSQTFFTLLIFGSTTIFLLFNNSGLNYLEKEDDYPVILKFFTQFILIPLLFIYVVILYLYSIKILINWELPRGWVSYLILAYSVVGILALLLVHPLKLNKAKSWVRIFSKVFYYTLFPLLILLFVAIFTRILEYSFTEPRYYVLVLAIWLSTVVLYFIFFKKATIKFIPISLFVFGFLALTLPFFNAFSVSKRSQKKDLEKILVENNLLKDGKIDFKQKVSNQIIYEIDSKFEFLDNRNERDYLFEFLNEEIKEAAKPHRYWSLLNYFPNAFNDPNAQTSNATQNLNVDLYSNQEFLNIEDYDYMISQTYVETKKIKIKKDEFDFTYTNSKSFIITLNGEKSVDIFPKIKELIEKKSSISDTNLADDLFVETQLENYKIKVVINGIHYYNDSSGISDIWMENLIYLIKEIE